MAKISGSIANFANGVSQQAMALRLATQGDLQLNAYSTVVDGLKKRPPTNRIASLGTDFKGDVYTHWINRDVTERYSVIMSPAGIRVFDLKGVEKSVNATSGYSYLSYPTAKFGVPPYKATTIGDYTFITNTSKSVKLDENIVEPATPSEALVHVMAGNYGKDYTISIDGVEVARYSTPDGSSGAQSPGVDTAYIARRLATGETKDLGKNANDKTAWVYKTTDKSLASLVGFTVKVFKGSIYIKKNNGTAFSLGVEDGYNGHSMKAIQKEVQDFADLPAFAEEGMAVKVTGSVSTKFDDYYVRFGKHSPNDDKSTPGVWREIPAPGILKSFAADTMPHVLVREADGTFTFKAGTWDQRKAGDDTSAPPPSFVGKAISDITFFKNRLGFLSEENAVLSRSGSFFDFWRATVTTLLDDDPIDVASAETNVSILRHAEAFADRLILFADQVQVSLMGNELLTPKTASIRPTTAYSMSSMARPVSTGDVIFFPVDRGQHSMIREYRVDPNSGMASAEDITGHIPQYIEGTVLKLAASTHEDILLVKSTGDQSVLYVYKYYWANDQKLQASWSKWTFPGVSRVLDFGFINSQLVLLMQRDNEVFIETMDVQPGGVDQDMDFVLNLDHRFREDTFAGRTYNPFTDITTVPMTSDITRKPVICVTAGSPTSPLAPGLRLQLEDATSSSVKIRGDMRAVPLMFGLEYTMRYRLSTIFIRQESRNGGTSVLTEGRLQLLQLLVQYSKTAYFRIEITPLAQAMRSYFTNGRIMGDPQNVTDSIHLGDGSFRVPILCKNDRATIEIVSDSYLPCSILSAEWVANYVKKSQRI